MKLLQTYYKEFKNSRKAVKEVNEKVKMKSFYKALGYSFLINLFITLLIVNLMILSQLQLLLAYLLVFTFIGTIFLYLELYYSAIKYFEIDFKCAKIKMLKIVYGFFTSMPIFVIGHIIIRYIFGGYV